MVYDVWKGTITNLKGQEVKKIIGGEENSPQNN